MTLQCFHSGLDPESSLFNLDSRFRGNDSSKIIVKPLLRHYTREGVDFEEAFEVIRWYQCFIASKVTRAIRGKMEEEEEGCDEFASDSDGSAKTALIAIDRSISAWAVIPHYNNLGSSRKSVGHFIPL